MEDASQTVQAVVSELRSWPSVDVADEVEIVLAEALTNVVEHLVCWSMVPDSLISYGYLVLTDVIPRILVLMYVYWGLVSDNLYVRRR